MLVFAWQLGAAQMGYFTRDEWMSGTAAFGVATTPEALLERLKQVYSLTRRSPEALRDLHSFTHKFCREDRKKNIDVGSATAMLQVMPRAQPITTTTARVK